MRLFEILVEALAPSQYRKYVKGWDKSRYADVFKKYTTDKKGYRIYLPFEGGKKRITAPYAILSAVSKKGYTIEDYALGIAVTDDGKRRIKIGKLLSDQPELLKKFQEDPQRRGAKNSKYLIVISRHPYDVAGMSTDRGWTSCMNLVDGSNRHYVVADVKEGTLVAYLVTSDDKNINKPVCRTLIKPFFEVTDSDKPKHVLLGIEDKVYGTEVEGFTDAVKKWVDEFNKQDDLDGVFQLSGKLYNDSESYETEKYVGKTGELLKKAIDNPRVLRDIKNVTPEMFAKIAVKNPDAFSYIGEKPTEWMVKLVRVLGEMKDYDVQLETPVDDESEDPMTWNEFLNAIPRKDEDVQIALVDNFGPETIAWMHHVSNRVIEEMFKRWSIGRIFKGYHIRGFPNREQLWKSFIKQVKKNKRVGGHTWDNTAFQLSQMRDIKIPDDVQLELVDVVPYAIVHIHNPTDEALKLSMKLAPDWLTDAAAGEFSRYDDKYRVMNYMTASAKTAAKSLLERAKKLKIGEEDR